MSADNELFELCKEVYKRTGWKDTHDVIDFYEGKYTVQKDCSGYVDPFKNGVYWSPLYTSDYLLKKLPPAIWDETLDGTKVVCLLTINMQGSGEAIAVYTIPYDEQFRGAYSNTADTPLKALLKLTIALDEAGELK